MKRAIVIVASFSLSVAVVSSCGDDSQGSGGGRTSPPADDLEYFIDADGIVSVWAPGCETVSVEGVVVAFTGELADGSSALWTLSATGDEPVDLNVLRLGEVPGGMEELIPWQPPTPGHGVLVGLLMGEAGQRTANLLYEAGPVGVPPACGEDGGTSTSSVERPPSTSSESTSTLAESVPTTSTMPESVPTTSTLVPPESAVASTTTADPTEEPAG